MRFLGTFLVVLSLLFYQSDGNVLKNSKEKFQKRFVEPETEPSPSPPPTLPLTTQTSLDDGGGFINSPTSIEAEDQFPTSTTFLPSTTSTTAADNTDTPVTLDLSTVVVDSPDLKSNETTDGYDDEEHKNTDGTSTPFKPPVTTNSSVPKVDPKIPVKPEIKTLNVEIRGNTTVQLPVDTVSLEAVVSDPGFEEDPDDSENKELKYTWTLKKQPDGSTGQMQKTNNRITGSQLIAGIYIFDVKVIGKDAAGEALHTVTVLKEVRVNQPPIAKVDPPSQSITLPTKKAIIDGSGSTDDDGIATYLWELKSGPLQSSKSENSVGHDKTLQLNDLVVGNYTYQLTVTDTDGESASIDAYVEVKKKIDHHPVANAGADAVIHLPQDSIFLYGNLSTDDWGIKSYQWSVSPHSLNTVVDLEGATTKLLHVSHMKIGEYKFQLEVTDTSDQTDTAEVTIHVQQRENDPPKAVAGKDQELLLPLEGPAKTVLNGNGSTDDAAVVSYLWEQIEKSPQEVTIVSPNSVQTEVTGLTVVGDYKFRLTVTDDSEAKSFDEITVSLNKASKPVAEAGDDVILFLPTDMAILDGSNSKDDYGITKYEWTRDPLSPAVGRVLNNTDHSARLLIVGLSEGTYTFHLTVTNQRGATAKDSVLVTVKSDSLSSYQVELHLATSPRSLTQEKMDEIIKKLSILLSDLNGQVVIRSVFPDHHADDLVVLFYLKLEDGTAVKASRVISELQPKLKADDNLLGVDVRRLDTYQCENPCSGHGRCHSDSQACECEVFWMENFFRVYAGDGQRNCDWSVLYAAIFAFIVVALLISFLYFLLCFICRPKVAAAKAAVKRRKQSKDYFKLNGRIKSSRKNNGIRNNFGGSSLMHSMTSSLASSSGSDEDSEAADLLYEKRKLISNGVGSKRRGHQRKHRRRGNFHHHHSAGDKDESTTLVAIDTSHPSTTALQNSVGGSDFDGYGLDYPKSSTLRMSPPPSIGGASDKQKLISSSTHKTDVL